MDDVAGANASQRQATMPIEPRFDPLAPGQQGPGKVASQDGQVVRGHLDLGREVAKQTLVG